MSCEELVEGCVGGLRGCVCVPRDGDIDGYMNLSRRLEQTDNTSHGNATTCTSEPAEDSRKPAYSVLQTERLKSSYNKKKQKRGYTETAPKHRRIPDQSSSTATSATAATAVTARPEEHAVGRVRAAEPTTRRAIEEPLSRRDLNLGDLDVRGGGVVDEGVRLPARRAGAFGGRRRLARPWGAEDARTRVVWRGVVHVVHGAGGRGLMES